MYQNYKIVIITPAGREKYLSFFKKFMYRKIADGLIDSWDLWLNTINPTDIAYIRSMAAENSKVKIYELDEPITPTWESYNALQTHKFMKFAQDDDTIYIRIDDDIGWVEEGALEKIIQARIDHPDAFAIYPNVINSTMCNSWHQEIGALSEEAGIVRKESQHPEDKDWAYLDAFSYTSAEFYKHIFNTFKKRYEENSLYAYYLPSKSFDDYKHFSICSLCWWGRDKIDCGPNEEAQMAWELPEKLKRPVWFCGDALVYHLFYHTQRESLGGNEEPFLEYFRKIVI